MLLSIAEIYFQIHKVNFTHFMKQDHHGMIAMSTIKKPWTLLLCTFCSTIEQDVKQQNLNINSGVQFCHSIHLTLFWTGGKFAPPAGFLNIAQKPLGLGS